MTSASTALNEFTLAFHKAVAAGTTGNIVFSPWSIVNGFAMVLAGAAGKSKEEILSAFKLDKVAKESDSETAVHEQLKALEELLRKSCTSSTYFEGANKVWVADGYKVLDSYLDLIRSFYNVDVGQADFVKNSQGAIKEINLWVEQNTKDKIRDLFPDGSLDGTTKLALANAVYFKGLWEKPFDKEDTRSSKFFVSKTKSVDVDMMYASADFPIYNDEELDVTVVELPYAANQFKMVLVLPNRRIDLCELEKKLTCDVVSLWTPESDIEFDLFVPKFKISACLNLKDILQVLSIQDIFMETSADLSGIDGHEDLFVSCAYHKAYVEADEEGTEAAAATGVGMVTCSMPMQIRFNRPFLFFIKAYSNDVILFWGKITNPLL